MVLCRIRGTHSSGYEEFYLLGYNAMQSVESQLMFGRNTLPPSLVSKNTLCLLPASCWFLAWLILWPWRCTRHVPPKRQLAFKSLYGLIFQNAELVVMVLVLCKQVGWVETKTYDHFYWYDNVIPTNTALKLKRANDMKSDQGNRTFVKTVGPCNNQETNNEEIWYFRSHKKVLLYCNVKGKAIPVTGRKGPQGCKTSRFPHFLDNRLMDGNEVVSPTRRPSFTPQKDSWYSFLLEAELTPGP
jgi:hypothetical protein